MNAEPSRLAAYADLVAAVLDLRGCGPTQAFDAALNEAVAAGTISDDLARQLRWLQRAGERAIVEHAEAVLPPALVALQTNASDQAALPDGRRPWPRLARPTPALPVEPVVPSPTSLDELRRPMMSQTQLLSSSCNHVGCSWPACAPSLIPSIVGPFRKCLPILKP